MGVDRLEPEFGRYAEWIVEAVATLPPEQRVPGACRGTANPALFERMASHLGISRGVRVLDLGCGTGGPGAWLRQRYGCAVVGVDVMEPQIRGLRRLFPDFPAILASSSALPFRPESIDAAWVLGVFELLEDKERALIEIHRVLRPRGRAAIYEFVAKDAFEIESIADRFTTADEMTALIRAADLVCVHASEAADMSSAPPEWKTITNAVRAQVRDLHGGDPVHERAERDRQTFVKLEKEGSIVPWEFVLVKEAS